MNESLSKWIAQDDGYVELEPNFDMSNEASQTRLLELCDTIYKSEAWDCPMTRFNNWLKDRYNLSLPLPPAEFDRRLALYAIESYAIQWNKFAFIDGKCVMVKYDYKEPSWHPKKDLYEKHEIENELIAFGTEIDAKSPTSAKGVVLMSYDNFAWVELQTIVISNAIQGIIIGGFASFLVLLVVTLNWYLSIIAITSIGCILITLFGVIELYGWKFGLTESTCVVIFVGISFDYVVHICH